MVSLLNSTEIISKLAVIIAKDEGFSYWVNGSPMVPLADGALSKRIGVVVCVAIIVKNLQKVTVR